MFTPRAFAVKSAATGQDEPRIQLDLLCRITLFAFVALTLLLMFAAPNVLRYAFTVLCVLAGAVLYVRNKPAYFSFVLWIWMLAAWVHRMVDYNSQLSVEPSPVMVAPAAVTLLSAWALITHARALARSHALPFACAFAGIAYGAFIGFLNANIGVLFVGKALATWLPAIFFAFFVYFHQEESERFRHAFNKTILYGLIVCSLYGLYQFFILPPWDRFWMKSVAEEGVFGYPVPMLVRDFSTTSSSQGFAGFIMTCVIFVIGQPRGWLSYLAVGLGVFCLPLTEVRTSWLGLTVGILFLIIATNKRHRIHVVTLVLGAIVAVSCVFVIPPVRTIVSARIGTLLHLQEDASTMERIIGTRAALHKAIHMPIGEGMGTMDTIHQVDLVKYRHARYHGEIGPHDNSFVEILFSLGYLGSAFYIFGLEYGIYLSIHGRRTRDPFVASMMAVVLALLSVSFLDTIVGGWFAVMLWLALAMSISSRQEHQRAARSKPAPFWMRTHDSASASTPNTLRV